ncbi:MAG: VWA domain-containing protein [Candidatus Eisenbacteria bacterium]|uniref:VWA domain-containing protein n=1 Tax=Eiseniibacteriota bacterium TaxID=2212470 RepID=A0A937XB33_UNCEI|nr:VWA domain-containing protein [Candidatus Eisenbacteria bacterium]
MINLGLLRGPDLLWWGLLIVGLAAAVVSYYRLPAPLSRRVRVLLRLIRVAAILLLLGLALEPLLTVRLPHAGRPRIALLIDRSSSMRLPGAGGGTRAAEAEAAWAALHEGLQGHFDLSLYRFAASAEAVRPEQEPRAQGWGLGDPHGATALGEALEGVLVQQSEAPLAGIVVVTDGAQTSGKDAARVARNAPVPIHALVVGDSVAPADLLLREVLAPPVAHAGEPLALRAVLEARRLPGWEATLVVRERDPDAPLSAPAGKEVARATVRLGEQQAGESEITLEFAPLHAGLKLYEVSASVPETEAVTVNNARLTAVEVRERKTQVLYLEGEPDWDFSFLKRAFAADTSLVHHYWVRLPDGAFRPYGLPPAARRSGPPRTAAEIVPYAAVIVGRLGPAALPAGFAEALREYLLGGGGVLFLSGARGGDLESWMAAGWEELLPLRVRPQPVRGYGAGSASIAPAGSTHEITALAERAAETERLWAALPPILMPAGDYAVSPGAALLLTARTGSPARDLPLLAVAAAGAGRVAVLAGRGLWRWDFVMRSVAGEGWAAREFWRRMSRWLSEQSERERFLARPTRRVFQDGEPLEFAARLLDDEARPVPAARVTLTVAPVPAAGEPPEAAAGREAPAAGHESRAPDGGDAGVIGARREQPIAPQRAELYPEGSTGRYQGALSPLPPGAYRYQAEAIAGSGPGARSWRAEGLLWVEPMGAEFLDLAADHSLPARLASASGGVSVQAQRIDDLLAVIPHGHRSTAVVKQAELWNHWPIFALATLLLALEWFMRRRRGLV